MGYAELSMENLKLASKVQMLEQESKNYRDRNEELNRQILILKDNNKQLTSGIDRYAEEKYRLTKDNRRLEDEKRVLKSRIEELEVVNQLIDCKEAEETTSEEEAEAAKSDAIFQKIGEALGLQGKIFEDWSFCSIFGAINEMSNEALTNAGRVAELGRQNRALLTELSVVRGDRDVAIKRYSNLAVRYDKAADKINELYDNL